MGDSETVSVRIVKVDYYLTKPIAELGDACYSGFRSLPIHQVPVIRVFGPTSEGQKCCIHIHGVFPYLFIPNWNFELGEKDFYAFAASLDKAINTSFAYSSSKTSHVYRISAVSSKPYYGYHENEKEFLKIEFYNPAIIKRAADVLLNGAVFNTSFQPHEAHVPYILQFFIDNNLYGMSFITFSSCRVRNEVTSDSPDEITKQTYMTLELDSCIRNIILESTSGDGMPNNPGLAFIWEEERKRRRQQKKESQITPSASQDRPKQLSTRTELYYKNKLSEKLKRFLSSNLEENDSLLDDENALNYSEELNSQALSILGLLEELGENKISTAQNDVASPPSSPSIVCSDDEEKPQSSSAISHISSMRSQPLFKLTAENDSILGDDFSDDNVDEDDHLMLSQSVYQAPIEDLSDDDFESEIRLISQLDGMDGNDPAPRPRKRKEKETKSKRYNLRSRNSAKEKSNDTKCTPKKQYPQLEIATQISPRSVSHVSPSLNTSGISSPFLSATSLPLSTSDSSYSPSTNSQAEVRKNETKRSYPQLGVNFKKSPRNEKSLESENDPRRRKLRNNLKKRKIDFDEAGSKENCEMSLMTTWWKKLERSKKEQRSGASIGTVNSQNSDCQEEPEIFDNTTSSCDYDIEDLDLFAPSTSIDTIHELKENTQVNVDSNTFYTISNEIGSQKYSLKIRFDACGSANKDAILQNLLTKTPVVLLEKMDTSNNRKAQTVPESKIKQTENETAEDRNSLEISQTSQVLSSKSDYSDMSNSLNLGGGSSQQSSSETRKSSEVDFWDIEGRSALDAAEGNNELTILPSNKNTPDLHDMRSCDLSSTLPLTHPMSDSGSEQMDDLEIDISSEEGTTKIFNNTFTNREQLPSISNYSVVDDEEFSQLTLKISQPCADHHCSKIRITERLPELSAFENSPVPIDDENLAPVVKRFSFESNEPCTENATTADADTVKILYSSINDDLFSASALRNKGKIDCHNLKGEKNEHNATTGNTDENDTDVVVFTQNSDDDEMFANFTFSQVEKEVGENEKNIVMGEVKITESVTPLKSTASTSVIDDGEIVSGESPILGEEKADVDKSCVRVGNSSERTRMNFDNSLWDTKENSADEEDKICSFYEDKSINAVNATMFCGEKDENTDDSVSEVDVLTPENERDIMSWNPDESFLTPSISNNDRLSDAEGELNLKSRTEVSSNDGSPSTSQKNVLHSTPQHARKKKSPSPTYTPILKKLMLKKMNNQTQDSQRFRKEPFLTNIREEEDELKNDIVIISDESISADSTRNTNMERNTTEIRSHSSAGSGQIDLTMLNTYGFRMSLENLQHVKANVQHQFITVMSVEIFVATRNNLNPDPEMDPIVGIFYSIFCDESESFELISGIILVSDDEYQLDITKFNCEKLFVKNENILLDSFVTLIRKWDPDILIGYEIEMLSWGYLIQRGQYLKRNYIAELSRVKEEKSESFKEKTSIEDNEYSDDLKLVGRIVLNVWRLMRHEIALQSYTFENVLFHILHQRVPQYSFSVLTKWWKNSLRRWVVVDYYLFKVECNILLLHQLDFIGRTSELARLFGIQFYEVLSRGSQFRVESMMLRLAKKQNYIAVSPSIKQRASMRAPESLPLIMEPESKFYTDPVIVLDFQSLYPSIIIAYNYCFSTCLGRVEYLAEKEKFKFGCVQHTVPVDLLTKLYPSLNVSPCGVAFVKESTRRGILPEMLEEILNTRLMVKQSMKENKNNKTLQRVLHARQLGLKLIANVTYGYTSANFSGRMPCIEVGDSVVSKGRETLERVIEMVSKNEKWAAKVIYGDTDSIFVMVPNRTKEEAFRIGTEIVEAVTNDNPKPVKLKLEKVYYPCILQTKKRYVGYMYENPDQKEPVYDAKGIETVRRDGCPAVAKILEKSLRLLFENRDVNIVKKYVQRQFSKLIAGRLSIQELTFAREYRGMNNYKPAACVPALKLAKQAILRDRRSEPRVKERVRYVLTVGPPGTPLIQSVLSPQEFLDTPGAIINAEYYITRAIIPALERCFSLLGVDVRIWYAELPRKRKSYLPVTSDLNNKIYKKKTISHYFTTSKCIVCETVAVSKVCKECQKNLPKLALTLGTMINKLQRKYNYLEKICRCCTKRNDAVECSSLDCPVYYRYRQAVRDVEQIPYLEELEQTFLRRVNM